MGYDPYSGLRDTDGSILIDTVHDLRGFITAVCDEEPGNDAWYWDFVDPRFAPCLVAHTTAHGGVLTLWLCQAMSGEASEIWVEKIPVRVWHDVRAAPESLCNQLVNDGCLRGHPAS